MTKLPRWTIGEIITRYDLEPSLDDTFVEGIFDKEIIESIYRNTNKSARPLYIIDAVDFLDELYDSHNLTKGNKQSLIILSREISGQNSNGRVRFIVDRDNDHWFGKLEATPGLTWTDYCDIESYFFDEELVRELILHVGRAKIEKWSIFFTSFCEVLRKLFIVRLATRELNISARYVETKRYLKIQNGVIELDLQNYVLAILNKSGAAPHFKCMTSSLERWNNVVKGDPRLHCRGHDLLFLINWSIIKCKGRREFTESAIEGMLVLLAPRYESSFEPLI